MTHPLPNSDEDRELLKRLVISYGDLQMALSAITFLGQEIDQDAKYSKIELRRFKCYETTFVVSYGRAFTKSNGGRFDRLSLKRIGAKLNATEGILHKSIIQMRNTIYAHSDEDFAHARVDFMKFEMPTGTFVAPHPQFEHGLEFADLFKRIAAMELTAKILDGVLETMRNIGERSPEGFLYLTPLSTVEQINSREAAAGVTSVVDITPRHQNERVNQNKPDK
ncbi:hypothetical protein HGO38_24505 [Rhizobium sp. CG5]|uniref:hypothetical protein n=1 Tax=Rhizobium sp. CG5 TaxID=2726076 RepID=UPI002033BE8E|nr:hypothetical protein [Rhizobium sp. CG5]MCM2476612.1 hypothetical protein [Rhizobium sp. CG5]